MNRNTKERQNTMADSQAIYDGPSIPEAGDKILGAVAQPVGDLLGRLLEPLGFEMEAGG